MKTLTGPGQKILFDLLKYQPHDGQLMAHNLVNEKRYTTVVCGRRWGKSTFAGYQSIYQALQPDDASGPPIVYAVSDTYNHATKVFDQVRRTFDRELKGLHHRTWKKELTIELKSGALIYAKSADNPSSLAGDGVTFAVVDESGFVSDYAMEVLSPALLDRKGKLLAIGTPDRTDTWFKRHFDLGFADEEFGSLQMPTSSNTSIPNLEDELARIRNRITQDQYRKYYLAEFLDLDENPFVRLLRDVTIHKESEKPQPGRRYVAGVDLADRQDYTFVILVDVTTAPFRVVHTDRWRGIGYENTGKRIAELLKKYNHAAAWVDRTGVGDAAISFITQHYGRVTPVVFTQKNKRDMFDTVATYLEDDQLELLNQNSLIEEMRVYRAVQTSRGLSYAAPAGQHDDGVSALLLASQGFKNRFYIPRGVNLGGFATAI